MAIIKEVLGMKPVTGKRVFIAENATLIGDVTTGDDCSIWYGAVLRGDVGPIRIGNRVNIQDNAILHATYGQSECIIGNDVSIGHGANVHGCTVKDNVLIGMGAVVMDNCIIPEGTVVAAGAVIPAGQHLEPGIWAGVPARKIRETSDQLMSKIQSNARQYLMYKEWYD